MEKSNTKRDIIDQVPWMSFLHVEYQAGDQQPASTVFNLILDVNFLSTSL